MKLRWHPFISPLTRRILVVNLVAPLVLVLGLFYTDNYQQGLIHNEVSRLTIQAAMMAGAVAEGAVGEQAQGFVELNSLLAQQMVRRLSESAQVHVRLFDSLGGVAADSLILLSPKGNIRVEPLPPPKDRNWRSSVVSWRKQVSSWMSSSKTELPPMVDEIGEERVDRWPEAVTALTGVPGSAVRARPDGGMLLSVAVPVQRYKQVMGALVLSADGDNVDNSLLEVRIAIVEIFGVALAVTIGLSLYMAGTISRPIRRLALAAERVRHGSGQRHDIPDFSGKGDEIGELSLALRHMTDALWQRMDAIERFAADVAHEIKNPLTSVRSAVETAFRVSNPEQLHKLLVIIQDDVERLNRLISDISDASRIDAELSRAEFQPVAIARMLQVLGDIHSTTDHEVRWIVDVPAEDPLLIQGIEGRLVQVLRNLIANAVSFSPPLGTITLRAYRENAATIIAVEDQGPGIPSNKLEAIFERFYSERPEREKFGTHSGLGLCISRQIVEAHRGALWAENREEGGARFTLRL